MKNILKRLETIYSAAAFAEAGEHDTAREMIRDEKRDQKRQRPSQRPRKELRAPGLDR